ncbi:mCG140918, partial [Mus musculus]
GKKVLEAGCGLSAFSPLTQSHPGALVGSLLHLRRYRSQQVDQRVPGWGAGTLQNSTKPHSHTRCPAGARLAKVRK